MEIIENNNVIFKSLISIIPIEYYGTPIEKLAIPPKYKILIKKIQVINSDSTGSHLVPETYIGIMDLNLGAFSKLKSVGYKNVNLLKTLQRELPNYLEMYFMKTLDKTSRKVNSNQLDISIFKIPLPFYYERLIKRIYRTTTPEVIPRTVGGVLNIKHDDFQSIKGVGERYIDLLLQLQDEIPIYIELYEKDIKKNIVLTTNNYEDNGKKEEVDIPLSELQLDPHYEKLLRKINDIPSIPQTVSVVLNINPYDFQKIKGVGREYLGLLTNFQKELPHYIESYKKHERIKKSFPEKPLSYLNINYTFLETDELKLLSKLDIRYGADNDVSNLLYIINLNPDLLRDSGFGEVSLNALNKLQKRILGELKTLLETNYHIDVRKGGLFISSKISNLELREIDNILIEDIENYLWTLDDMSMDIAVSQWGFNHPYNILEEIAKKYKLTKERIRQLTIVLNINLLRTLRLHPKVLWANIRENSISDLERLLPNLVKCFGSKRLFYSFLEICCQVPKGSIENIALPDFKTSVLNQYFSRTPSPVSHEEVIGELMSNFGYSRASAENIIRLLAKSRKLKISDKGIMPRNMDKKSAIAHVLSNHPAGLPWKDISRIVNVHSFSSKKLSENRLIDPFITSDMVYLCALGTYRHIMFLNMEQLNIKGILQNIIKFLKSNRLKRIHLHDYFYQNKKNCQCNDYFTLRHIAKYFGEEYGLFFSGASNTDSVSLNEKKERIPQSKVIIQALNQASGAMTIREIAERLRSKSVRHAQFYITNLAKEGNLIRIDRMMYTTPEKAFKNVNKGEILEVVKDIMNSSELIVDVDVFRERVNQELNLSYSKYFYAALVKTELKKLKWYNKYSLFSTESIPYNSLYDISKQHCDLLLSNQDNIKTLQKHVMITEASAIGIITNLRFGGDNTKFNPVID